MQYQQFVAAMGEELGAVPTFAPPIGTLAAELPEPLRQLYMHCDGGDVLIGTLYEQQDTLDQSRVGPFLPDWMVFGDDSSGSFWLCARQPLAGCWFTSWDHDSGGEPGEPAFEDLGAFLADAYDSTLQRRRGGRNALVVSAVPVTARSLAAVLLKELAGVGGAAALRLLATLPQEIRVDDALQARTILRRLRAAGASCHLQLDFL